MSSSEEKTTSPPARRRRSSILRRKSVIPIAEEHTYELALREYISDTKREKSEWDDLYRQRKSQFKISEDALAQVTAEPPTITPDVVQQDLTEDDIIHFQQRPDYEKLCNDMDRFVETAAMIKAKLKGLQSVSNYTFLSSKARLNALSNSICTFNDTVPLWLQDPLKIQNRKVK
ncbi:uncharacterized protein LOC117640966 [Thrips palmi]|uniref:Uncharacterized protein LOC117640966 n=1 Tax=Thrips palmi TaxID=161013 RepID=A0A6P8YAZ1_THRPL|nr:uncharacterized protein LOC117640966 [Thrips palmi]